MPVLWCTMVSYISLPLATILGLITPLVGYTAQYLNLALAIVRLLMVVKVQVLRPINNFFIGRSDNQKTLK